MNYQSKLLATKTNYPFEKWLTYSEGEEGLEQYTRKNCEAAAAIFDDLIASLIELGASASEDEKIGLFQEAVESLNTLNDQTDLIETGEREELCDLLNQIGRAAGIEVDEEEETVTEWRDW